MRAITLFVVGWFVAGDVLSQEPPSAAAGVIDHACGLSREDGISWGIGPDYKVRFGDAEVEFVPALGRRTPHNLPLLVRLLSVGRRAGAAAAAPPRGVRSEHGLSVRYSRPGLIETWELRPEGVEQSFTFEELPPGTGDLVVRCRIDSELGCTAPDTDGVDVGVDGLAFTRAGVGGVQIGAVTGIDANGARTKGSMRYEDGVLELALPAAFVDRARLPLVLDPLFGTTITVASAFDEEEPDVAAVRESGSSVFLVVWQRRFSDSDTDIRGQRVRTDGTLLGGLIGIRTSSTLRSTQPRVAPVSLRDRFVVVWTEHLTGRNPRYIAARSIHAGTAAGSNAIQVVAGTDSFGSPDVGGDHHDLDAQAIAVWENATQRRIEGYRLRVAADGSLSRLTRTILSGTFTASEPAIAETGGEDGRYLVAWRTGGGPAFSSVIRGTVINRFMSIRDTLAITAAGGEWEGDPDVDGDGDHWFVAYESNVAVSLGDVDVRCQWVNFDEVTDSAYLGGEGPVANVLNSDETNPVVALDRNSVLVGFADERFAGVYDARVKSMDWFSCQPCEGFFDLELSNTRDARNIAVAHGAFDATMLLVWESRNTSTQDGDLKAQRFAPEDGFWGIGPFACGRGGRVFSTCARANPGFALRLERAEPNRPVFLLFGLGSLSSALGLQCGTCSDIVDPFSGFAFAAGSTNAHGDAAVQLPLPAGLAGLSFLFQWIILPSDNPGCPALGIDLSEIGLTFVGV